MDKIHEVVQRIGKIATTAAQRAQLVFEATVIGFNPDGTINVDDGLGGCARVAPKANVKIGDRIRVGGNEPAIGTTTDLPQVTHTCQGSTKPCPKDDRRFSPGPPTDTPLGHLPIDVAAFETLTTKVVNWSDREVDQGDEAVGGAQNCSNFFGYLGTHSGPVSRSPWAGYRREVVDVCTPTVIYTCVRVFGRCDLTVNGIPLSGLSSLKLGFMLSSISDPGQETVRIYVVPATKGPPLARPFPVADRSKPLGSFMVADATAFGFGTYGIIVDLDFPLLYVGGVLPDPLYLCLMTEHDLNGTVPPLLHALIDNEDVTSHILGMLAGATIRLSFGVPTVPPVI